MTKLLNEAIEKLSQLPEAQQETMAQWILDELADEAQWDYAFANSLPQLEQWGKQALEDFEAGLTEELIPDDLE